MDPTSTPGHTMLARRFRLGLCLALMLLPQLGHAQGRAASATDTAALQRLLVAEDARGRGSDGADPLVTALNGTDTLLRRVAIRGLGRLQRPDLGRLLLPSLADPLPSIRAEAANAIAQSMRGVGRGPAAADSAQLTTRDAATALTQALATETDPHVVDALGQSLGRLPLPDSTAARAAEDAIRARLAARATPGLVHGLYTLARARRVTGNLTAASVALLRSAAVAAPDTMVRRLGLSTLAVAGGFDSATAVRASRDPDDETRRMALRGSGALSASLRSALVRRALADPSPIVRIEAIVAARLGETPPDCTPILAATRDREPYVVLAAVDALGGGCADVGAAATTLRRLAVAPITTGPPDHRWQVGAHALLALARLDTAAAAAALPPRMAGPTRAGVRQYAARTAAAIGARRLLFRLAADQDHNVQEAAIAGLAATAAHDADTVYLRALGSRGNQVVLAAVQALKGSPHPGALAALLAAFDSVSARRTENVRDPRVAMLERIGELGSTATAAKLEPYLADYDTTVATVVATTLTRWTGAPVQARPVPLPIRAEPLASVFLHPIRLRVTMAASSGGGVFTVRLLPDEAPATVARVLRLVRERFYDGRVFQRVEPNFVVQGGGPDANEYVGDAAFMRDELAPRAHARGTLGISARGRDTGDGQWFINLVDNPSLDHEYTVFGRIDGGQGVAERILEGDRIGRVEVVEER